MIPIATYVPLLHPTRESLYMTMMMVDDSGIDGMTLRDLFHKYKNLESHKMTLHAEVTDDIEREWALQL